MMKSFNWAAPTLIAIAVAMPALSQTKETDQKCCNASVEAHHEVGGRP
jgi:hypothetical protein